MTYIKNRLELFDEMISNVMGICTIDSLRIKDFISESIQQALAEERERVNNKIEEYFDGLIVVPSPQATKDNLLSSFREINNK